MKTFVAAGIGIVVGAVITAILFVTLGGDEEPVQANDSNEPTKKSTDSEAGGCAEAIPQGVLDDLGWTSQASSPTERLGVCEWRAKEGYITVAIRPTLAAADQEEAKAAEDALDRICPTLKKADGTYEQPVGFLDGTPACANRPAGERGLSQLILVTERPQLVQIRVAANQPTKPDNVEKALASLAKGAESL